MRKKICAAALPILFAAAANPTINPGDDFFAYANDGWLKATTIPAGRERWGARDELEAQARRRIATLLDDASTASAGSAARKVADFRAAFLNEAAIEAKGLAPLQPLFDQIEKISDKTDLTRELGRGMRADADPMGFGIYDSATPLGLSVEQSIHGEKTNVAFLVQGGAGPRDRETIRKIFTLAHFEPADERASALLALETALAQSHAMAEASSNDHNADNVWTRDDFVRRATGMDWNVFFDAAGLGDRKSSSYGSHPR